MQNDLKQGAIVQTFYAISMQFERIGLTLSASYLGFLITNNNNISMYFDTIQEVKAFHDGLILAKDIKYEHH